MNKRPQIKGRGADLFLGESTIPASQHTSTPAKQHAVKATFYLGEETVSELDNLWLTLRKTDRNITQSGLVNDILKNGIIQRAKE
jgi:hypothetical protein